MLLSLGLSLPLMCLLALVSARLEALGLPPEMANLSGGYLRAVIWGVPGFLLFVNMRTLFEGFSRTRPAMVIALLGLALNVPLNYALIYGELGFPQLGAVGCGIASAASYWFMALCMLAALLRDPQFKSLRPLLAPFVLSRGRSRFDPALLARMLRIGMPGACSMVFEVTLFSLGPLILAPLGEVEVAGLQLVINYGTMLFMVPLSLGMATTIRVGTCLGAGDVERARLVTRTALLTGAALGAVSLVLTLLFRHAIAAHYNRAPAVLVLASQLFLFQASFQLIDYYQTSCLSALRGYNDTRVILRLSLAVYWALGLPLAVLLSRTDLLAPAMGAKGFLLAFCAALLAAALLYSWRIAQLHRKSPLEIRALIRR